jgi:hypothetical protein
MTQTNDINAVAKVVSTNLSQRHESNILANISLEGAGEVASGRSTEKLPGAGRLAVSDLLAIPPHMGGLSATSETSNNATSGVSEKKEIEFNVAAVGGALTTRVKDAIVSLFSSLVAGVVNVLK